MVRQLFSLSGFLRLFGLLLLATFALSALQPQPFDPDRPEARSLFGSKPKNDSRPRRLPTAVDVPVETEVVSAVVEAEPVADTRADASKETRASAVIGSN